MGRKITKNISPSEERTDSVSLADLGVTYRDYLAGYRGSVSNRQRASIKKSLEKKTEEESGDSEKGEVNVRFTVNPKGQLVSEIHVVRETNRYLKVAVLPVIRKALSEPEE